MDPDILEELEVWKTLQREAIVDAPPWLKVWKEKILLPNGKEVDEFYTLEQPDYVVVFSVTDTNRTIGFWRYKHGSRRVNLGLPAGQVEPGEDPLEAARREFLEETGYQAREWRHLGSFTADGNRGLCQAHLFFASHLQEVARPDPDDLEEMRMVFLTQNELREHLLNGNVSTLGVASAIALAMNEIKMNQPEGV